MNDKKQIKWQVFAGIGVLMLLTAVGGLWLVPMIAILGTFAGVLWLMFQNSKKVDVVEPLPEPPAKHEAEPVPQPTEQDVQKLAYAVILRRITELVLSEYPDARWVWESPNAFRQIMAGEEVFILLNRAGGYRRAGVTLKNLQVVGLCYPSAHIANTLPETEPEETEQAKPEEEKDAEPEVENYELLAFEWVDAHTLELNAKCNEAVGQGLAELVLPAEELPIRESWPDVCRELMRTGLSDVRFVPEGIKIDLTQ